MDAALAGPGPVMVGDAADPFAPKINIVGAADQAGILQRDGTLVIEPVKNPGLNMALIERAIMQSDMKGMFVVIALCADGAQPLIKFEPRPWRVQMRSPSRPGPPPSRPPAPDGAQGNCRAEAD